MRKILSQILCLSLALGQPVSLWASNNKKSFPPASAPAARPAALPHSPAPPAAAAGSRTAPEFPAAKQLSAAALKTDAAAASPSDETAQQAAEAAFAGNAASPRGQDGTPPEAAGESAAAQPLLAPHYPAVSERPAQPPSVSVPSAKRPFFIRHYRLARLVILPFLKIFYRIHEAGAGNLPAGPALITPNHVSYVDALVLSYATNRPMRFMLKREIYGTFGFRWFFEALGAIPIQSGKTPEAKAANELALATARRALQDGQSVVIFPEGKLTLNGNMFSFRPGFTRIVSGLNVPVVPAHIDGLWGSVFSQQRPRSFWSRVSDIPRPVIVRFGKPLEKVTPQAARESVQKLSASSMELRVRRWRETPLLSFLRTAKKNWWKRAYPGASGKDLTFGRALVGTILLSKILRQKLDANPNVGVLLPSTSAGVVANAALALMGKISVNLNYSVGQDAVDHTVKTTKTSLVITSREFVEALKNKGSALPQVPYLYMENLAAQIPSWKKTLYFVLLYLLPRRLIEELFFADAPRDWDFTMTLLATSGSSSLPKAVELTQLNIGANIEMAQEVISLKRGDSILGVLPFFHAFGETMLIWLPLILGVSAVFHPDPFKTKVIAALSEKHRPTILMGTPTMLKGYAEAIPAAAFKALRLVIAGAEKLGHNVAAAFKKAFGLDILEGFGSTELSPVAAVNIPDIVGKDGVVLQVGNKPGTVGHPLPGSAALIVDPESYEPLPYGREGLLLVYGPHVMKGYFDNPGKTAEALRNGWYVTKDKAVIDADGFVRILGRYGREFKIAGENVSPEAVEEKLLQAAGQDTAAFAVTSLPDPRRGKRVVVLYSGYDGAYAELMARAKELGMPNLWVAAKKDFHKVEALPLLGSGKLDLRALDEMASKLSSPVTRPSGNS